MDTVEEMLKKQEDFEKMLAAQEEKFHMLNRETKVWQGNQGMAKGMRSGDIW